METPLKAKPKLDLVFKKIFADENNTDILVDFLSSVLEIDKSEMLDVKIIDNEIIPDILNQKFSRLDLLLEVPQGKINIEIQVNNYGDFTERTLYYWAKKFSSQLNEGDAYIKLQPTVSINIIDFNLFGDSEASHSSFRLLENERHTLLNDKLRIDFLELPKAKKTKTKPELQEWLDFFNVTTEEGLEMLDANENTSQEVKKAIGVVKKMSADEKALYEIEQREKRLRDENSALYFARAEGEAKGRAKGRAEERNDIFQMLKGMSDEEKIKYINSYALQ